MAQVAKQTNKIKGTIHVIGCFDEILPEHDVLDVVLSPIPGMHICIGIGMGDIGIGIIEISRDSR